MKFSRKIQLIEQLLARVIEVTDDENVNKISEELLEMKKQEVLELVELATSTTLTGKILTERDCLDICWSAYIAGELK